MTTTQTTQAPATTVEYFETIYAEARGDASAVPWADGRPNPALVNWLNAVAPSLIRCGGRVAVVGCGLGDDARELLARGYEVTAFDCSETAVNWARKLDPNNASCYHVADVFNPPSRWHHRFDLVVEINTLQSLQPDAHRLEALQPLSNLLARQGRLLVICRAANERVDVEDGPPWPLTEQELLNAAGEAGLEPDGEVSQFEDDETPPVLRMRVLLQRQH